MNLGKVVSGIGVLIAVYLFVSHSSQTAKIVTSIGESTTSGIKTLQGR